MSFRFLRYISSGLALTLLAALGGCQSTDTGGVLDVGAQSVTAVPVDAEIAGEGAVKIAVVAPLSGSGAGTGKALRQGAEMALEDLGAGKLALAFYDSAGSAGRLKGAAEAIDSAGISMTAVAAGPQALMAFAPASAITIAMVPDDVRRPQGSFAFLPSASDSLVYGVRFALTAKPGSVLLFIPADIPAPAVKALQRRIGAFGTVIPISYRPSQTSAQIADRARPHLAKTSVVAFAGNEAKIAQIVKALNLPAANGPAIVGNIDWTGALFGSAEMQGALVPSADTGNHGVVAGRYSKKYGAEPPVAALYAYDFVAVAAGIVRSRGAEALNRQTLVTDAGFRGTSGSFRFRPDGRTERLFAMNFIDGGQLKPLKAAPKGF